MQCKFNRQQAAAIIHGGSMYPHICGRVRFYQKSNCVLVVADIHGLPRNSSGFFGFHIHDGSGCGGETFSDSGSHYNPANTPHPAHAGDLPPLMLCGNSAHLEVLTDRFKVCEIIGRTVIIHNMPDDFTSQPAGNAGTKIACGIIKAVGAQ